ncbi:MAG: hypothetical protein H7Y88_00255 [Phycisphaerales bacterium]|nr:hypothetical protein [Phycisphaerales bacterium]
MNRRYAERVTMLWVIQRSAGRESGARDNCDGDAAVLVTIFLVFDFWTAWVMTAATVIVCFFGGVPVLLSVLTRGRSNVARRGEVDVIAMIVRQSGRTNARQPNRPDVLARRIACNGGQRGRVLLCAAEGRGRLAGVAL